MNLDAIGIVSDLDKDEIKLLLDLQDKYYETPDNQEHEDLSTTESISATAAKEESPELSPFSSDEIDRLREQKELYEKKHQKKFSGIGEFVKHLIRIQMKGNNSV